MGFCFFLNIWLHWILADTLGIFAVTCGILVVNMWDPALQPSIEPGPPALGAGRLSPWTTWELLVSIFEIATFSTSQASVGPGP